MDGYEPATYGRHWAEHYDDLYGSAGKEVFDFVRARADGGPILELAPGTGRITLPLQQNGLTVDGVEISDQMLARLRAKPGGRDVEVVARDMTGFTTDNQYPLVLLAFNTLFAPLEEHLQQGVFDSVHGALADGGSFVIDCFIPDLGRFDREQTVRVSSIELGRIVVEYAIHHPDQQRISTMVEVKWSDGRRALLPVDLRYLWPEQIDEMANRAGLELVERFQWYDEAPFTDASPRHVSVYRKPGGPS
jgi:hypothetical protein